MAEIRKVLADVEMNNRALLGGLDIQTVSCDSNSIKYWR